MSALLDDFVWKPCSRGNAYEFFPKKAVKVDMKAAAEALGGFDIEMESKFLILLTVDGKTVSVFHSGKVMVRGERDEEKARKTAEKVLKRLKEILK